MTRLSKQDYYEVLDATLTDILVKGGVEITPEIVKMLLSFNRVLMEALELTH